MGAHPAGSSQARANLGVGRPSPASLLSIKGGVSLPFSGRPSAGPRPSLPAASGIRRVLPCQELRARGTESPSRLWGEPAPSWSHCSPSVEGAPERGAPGEPCSRSKAVAQQVNLKKMPCPLFKVCSVESQSSAGVGTAVCPNTPSALQTLTSLPWAISTCLFTPVWLGASWGL